MQVFFGSSTESSELMEEVASWLEREEGISILLWTDRRAFPLGTYTLDRLIELTKIVDAAVFMFGEDDRVWYRDTEVRQPRDNVLLEYGMFAARLGLARTIVCRINKSKVASDLLGLTTLNVAANSRIDAKLRVRDWARQCKEQVASAIAADEIRAQVTTPGTCDHVSRLLLPDELAAFLKEMPQWRTIVGTTNDAPPRPKRELARVYKFPTYLDAMRFMAVAGEVIDRLNHHPRWENLYDQVVVYLTTWNVGHNISALDTDLARYLEDLYRTRFAPASDAGERSA